MHGKLFHKHETPNDKKTDLTTGIFQLNLERTSVTAVQIEEQLANTQLEAVAIEHGRWKCSCLWLCLCLRLCLLLSRGGSKHRSYFLDCCRVSFDVKTTVRDSSTAASITSVACAWVIIASKKIIQIIPAPTKEKITAETIHRNRFIYKRSKVVKMEPR
jgi:hypothetical protein